MNGITTHERISNEEPMDPANRIENIDLRLRGFQRDPTFIIDISPVAEEYTALLAERDQLAEAAGIELYTPHNIIRGYN